MIPSVTLVWVAQNRGGGGEVSTVIKKKIYEARVDTNPPWTYSTWVHEVQASWCHGAHSLYPIELNQIPEVFCLVRGWLGMYEV